VEATVLATDSGFLNTRELIIMPSDPFSMSLRLVNSFGQPINLLDTDIRWRVVPRGTGMRMSITRTASGVIPADPGSNPLTLTVLDSPTGSINLACTGDVLNDPRGYDYAVDVKPMSAEDWAYRAVARGSIQIFNLPRAV
jgi:hypothetical protein